MAKRIQIGFQTGSVITALGVSLRIFSEELARTQISEGVSTVSSTAEETWIQLSIAMIIFGGSLLLMTFNRWLSLDDGAGNMSESPAN